MDANTLTAMLTALGVQTVITAPILAILAYLIRSYVTGRINRDLESAKADFRLNVDTQIETLRHEQAIFREEFSAKRLALHERRIEAIGTLNAGLMVLLDEFGALSRDFRNFEREYTGPTQYHPEGMVKLGESVRELAIERFERFFDLRKEFTKSLGRASLFFDESLVRDCKRVITNFWMPLARFELAAKTRWSFDPQVFEKFLEEWDENYLKAEEEKRALDKRFRKLLAVEENESTIETTVSSVEPA